MKDRNYMEMELRAIEAELRRQADTMNAMNYAMGYTDAGQAGPLWEEFKRASHAVAFLDEASIKLKEMLACL